MSIIILILIILIGFLVHDAATIALEHVDWLVMFNDRNEKENNNK